MIKIKSRASQLDNVIVQIEFDDQDGKTHQFASTIAVAQLLSQTPDQIKAAIVSQAKLERMKVAETLLKQKFDPLIGEDLETKEKKANGKL